MMSLDWGAILGGFGLFMFGIQFMGDGLKAAAGDQLRDLINKYTSNRIMAVLLGILLTVFMQSSSATSAITIGLVRANLMTLEQAAGIILGATIGTTVTSFLISVNIDQYALYIVFIGCMLICFSKKKKTGYIGRVILGFGLIFFGMGAMGDGLAELKALPEFEAFALKMASSPLLSFVTGIGLTALVQSSAATIGVAQKLYQAGAIAFSASLPFMFGANIGTTVTGLLASLGGSTEGKRTAALHITVNLIAAALGMSFLRPYASFIQSFTSSMSGMMQIAVANMVFKTVTSLAFLPFIHYIVMLVKRIVPGEDRSELELSELDESITTLLPSVALKASSLAYIKMVDMVRLNVMKVQDGIRNAIDTSTIEKNEASINRMDQRITDYLIQLSTKNDLSDIDTEETRRQLDAVKNLERIGDLTVNLSEFQALIEEEGIGLSEIAKEETEKMLERFLDMFDLTAEIFMTRSREDYEHLLELEKRMDARELKFRANHFSRMQNQLCSSPIAISVYCDILGTIERMGDHCCNICKSTVTGMTSDLSDDEILA